MAKILLVEDNLALAEAVQEALLTQGHVVEHAVEGNEGLDRLKLYFYDLAILDWMLPGITGVEILARYRAEGGKAPILMLTSKDQISEKEHAFDAGADEYLTKPFNSRELLARVRALMRRPPLVQKKIFECGYLAVDVNARTVTKQGQPVDLAAAEYSLLELFIRNPGRIFSSEELLSRVFVSDAAAGDEAVRQRILRLRKKIDAEGLESPIKTIKGFGYKLEWAESSR